MADSQDELPEQVEGEEADEGYGFAEYSTEDLLEQAQSNAQATIVATIGFLTERGIPAEEWAAAIGGAFARLWDEGRAWEAGEFLDAMLTNFRSLGAEVISSELGIDRAEAAIGGFPSPFYTEAFGVDPAHVLRYVDAARVIAAKVGLVWEWKQQRDRLQLVVRRAGTG